jgi:hypothetical protein
MNNLDLISIYGEEITPAVAAIFTDVVIPLHQTHAVNLLAGRDVIVDGAQAKDISLAFVPTLLGKARSDRHRVTVLLCSEENIDSMMGLLGKLNLESDTTDSLGQSTGGYTGDVLVCDLRGALEFVESEKFRASDIGRVCIIDIEPSYFDKLYQSLDKLTTRGRRPQLIGLVKEPTDRLKSYFRLPQESAKHYLVELEGDLLAKPNALSAFIESEGRPSTLIYCNQPSDADFIDVMLKKVGISSTKLIGNAPQQKVASSLTAIKSGRTTALIVTDVSAKFVEANEFELVINYSIPNDPEIYITRTEGISADSVCKRVLSLVGPLDRANFHYIKKVVEADFESVSLPAAEKLTEAKLTHLRKKASELAPLLSEEVKALAAKLASGEDVPAIIGYLLSIEAESNISASSSSGNDDHDDRRSSSRRGERDWSDRGVERSSDRDRGARNDRGDRRSSKDTRDENSYEREERVEQGPPPLKIARVYLEQSGETAISAEWITSVCSDDEALKGALRRVSIRPNYAFVDLDSEQWPKFEERIKGVFSSKAIDLSIPAEAF